MRKRIYHFALVPERVFVKPFVPIRFKSSENQKKQCQTPNLALLRVCKIIYHEAILVFYGENVFSIVTPDFFFCLLRRYPRLTKHLGFIRSVEIIFDIHDFKYLTGPFCSQLKMMGQILTLQEEKFSAAKAAAKEVFALRARLAGAEEYIVGDSSGENVTGKITDAIFQGNDDRNEDDGQNNESDNTDKELKGDENHEQAQVEGKMRHAGSISSDFSSLATPTTNTKTDEHERGIRKLDDFLWGRTLTFVRQHLRLNHLHLNFEHCLCPAKCCRLASEVMEWGSTKRFDFDLPEYVSISGATEEEREEIMSTLRKQCLTKKTVAKHLKGKKKSAEQESEVGRKTAAAKRRVPEPRKVTPSMDVQGMLKG